MCAWTWQWDGEGSEDVHSYASEKVWLALPSFFPSKLCCGEVMWEAETLIDARFLHLICSLLQLQRKGLPGAQGQDKCFHDDLQLLKRRAVWHSLSISAQADQRPDYKAIWLALIKGLHHQEFLSTSYQNLNPHRAIMISMIW